MDSARQRIRQIAAPDRILLALALLACAVAGGLWLALTPEGVYGKADAVGYAVCHRITVRSFLFPDGRQLPMCARCSGTFIGVMAGLFVPGLFFGKKRAAKFPPPWAVIMLVGFSAWWAFDGTNSFSHLMPLGTTPRLYQPTNFLRLTTGMFHGITMGSLVLPAVNATLWALPEKEPTLDKPWHMLVLFLIGVTLIAMVYSEHPIFLYPLGLISAVGTIAVLTSVNTILITTIFRRDNTALDLLDALPMILFGIAATFTMLGLVAALRFTMFGSWDGVTM